MRDSVEADPENLARRFNLGLLALELGEYEAAVQELQHVADGLPDSPDALNALGNALRAVGRVEDAVTAHEGAVTHAPQAPEAWNDLANTYIAWGRPEAAEPGFERALALAPDALELHYNLATARERCGKYEAAVEGFQHVLAENPLHVDAWTNLGIALKGLGRLPAAREAQHKAVELDPDNHDAQFNLALTELMQGEFEAGWRRLEHRRQIPGYAEMGAVAWDGSEQPEATLHLYAEQGLGDTLQFMRFASAARARVGRVVLRCRPALLELLSQGFEGADAVESLDEPVEDALYAPLMSLPHLLGLGGALAAPEPYLRVPTQAVEAAAERLLGQGPAIGLCFQGNPRYRADRERSMPLSMLRPVLELTGPRFYSLQKHHGVEQLAQLPPDLVVTDLGSGLDESTGAFVETAAVMKNLSLFLTTDSASAHLAGALGVETWLMLPHVPDFRWGMEGNRWYPSARLFRQPQRGDWATVVEEVRIALQARFGEAAG